MSLASKAGPGAVTAVSSAGPTIVVRNHHWVDLRVYVMSAQGASARLGIVPRVGASTFALPPVRLPAGLTFVAVPLGDAEPQVVGPVDVDVGTRLLFTVEGIPSASSLVKQR
jgi:hypothetical protein